MLTWVAAVPWAYERRWLSALGVRLDDDPSDRSNPFLCCSLQESRGQLDAYATSQPFILLYDRRK